MFSPREYELHQMLVDVINDKAVDERTRQIARLMLQRFDAVINDYRAELERLQGEIYVERGGIIWDVDFNEDSA